MAGDKHSLPRYPEGATIWFKGKTWNQIAERLESWRVMAGSGIRLETYPTGTVISAAATAAAVRQPQWRVILRLDGETWKARVVPGWVLSINPASSAQVMARFMPTVSGTPLNHATPPEIAVGDGDHIFVRVQTDEKDIIEDAPTIVVHSDDQDGAHAQPPPVSTPGDYYYLLAVLAEVPLPEDAPEGAIPLLIVDDQIHEGGPLIHRPTLWEGGNVGGKREIFKGLDPSSSKYEFRTLEQLVVENGAEIIRALDPGDAGADPPVAPETEGDTIQFRAIVKNNSGSVPYSVAADGNAIKLTFNGAEGTYEDPFEGSITIAAGLITAFASPSVTGKTGTIGLQFQPKGGGSFQTLSFEFTAGVFTGVSCSQGVIGDGSAADPYVVLFSWGDT